MAVAVAVIPELVLSYFDKQVMIETKGELTAGSCAINWSERELKHPRTKIVDNFDKEKFLQLLIDSTN